MKKIVFYFIFLISVNLFSQNIDSEAATKQADSISYEKTTDFIYEKEFNEDLKEKYNDTDFHYTEEKEDEVKQNSSPSSQAFANAFLFFISKIFPFLLGGILIFIILKTFLGSDFEFWKFKKKNKKVAEKLIYEDEDIHEINLENLLKEALDNQNYRLAIRYYYLISLKKLSDKKLIDYHKDKTNSEYLFEIENQMVRKDFSYLSYIFTYVWYGEFDIDNHNFSIAENKYKSFFKTIN